jgi:hypothetical protein
MLVNLSSLPRARRRRRSPSISHLSFYIEPRALAPFFLLFIISVTTSLFYYVLRAIKSLVFNINHDSNNNTKQPFVPSCALYSLAALFVVARIKVCLLLRLCVYVCVAFMPLLA